MTESADRAAAREPAEVAFGVFCRLWAIAVLFHIASYDRWASSVHHFALVVSAVSLLVRPSSISRLLVFAALQIFSFGVKLPYVANHYVLVTAVNVAILQSFLLLVWRRQTFDVCRMDLYRTFAPVVRILLVVLYFFAFVHKLNTAYFSPDVSCGAKFYLEQLGRFPVLPKTLGFQIAALYFTLLIEGIIPLLLWFRPTRHTGVLVAALFHAFIGLNPQDQFYNFSSILFAVLFLFTPEDLAASVKSRYRQSRLRARLIELTSQSYSSKALFFYLIAAAGAVAILTLFTWLHRDQGQGFFVSIWAMYSMVLIGLFTCSWGRAAVSGIGPRPFVLYHRSLWLAPVLLGLNGLSPYVGLKTETSFAMFSNLRTEGDRSNHLFIPVGTQVFGFQRDLVEVTSSSEPILQRVADGNHLLPFFEVRRVMSDRPDHSVSFIRNGVEETIQRVGDHRDLVPEVSLLERKLLFMRPVSKVGLQKCVH